MTDEIDEGRFLAEVSDEDLVRAGLFGDVPTGRRRRKSTKRKKVQEDTEQIPTEEQEQAPEPSEEVYAPEATEDDQPIPEDRICIVCGNPIDSDAEEGVIETDEGPICPSCAEESEESEQEQEQEGPQGAPQEQEGPQEEGPTALDIITEPEASEPKEDNPLKGADPVPTEEDVQDRREEMRLLDPGDSEEKVIDGTPTVIVREEPDKDYMAVSRTVPAEAEEVQEDTDADDPGKEGSTEGPEGEGDEQPDKGSDAEEADEEQPKQESRWEKLKREGRFSRWKAQNGEDPEIEGDVRPSFRERAGKIQKKIPKMRTPQRKKGTGDPDPDSLGERFRRARLLRSGKYVILRTLYRDEATGEYIREATLVQWKDLPREAVACTGEKGVYCHDKIGNSEWYYRNHVKNMASLDAQFTASDAWLYMMNNKIDNALAVHWTELSRINPMKFVLPILAGVAILMIILMR